MVPDWPAPAAVRALSTFRWGGQSTGSYASLNLGDHVGDSPGAVAANRQRLVRAAELPAEPNWLRQVHGTEAVNLDELAVDESALDGLAVDESALDESALDELALDGLALDESAQDEWSGAPAPAADAAYTRSAKRICAILTADCMPILLAADTGDLVAAVHAGWRGLAAGILAATVRSVGVAPRGLMAWIGPCIGPEYYEVGTDVRDALCGSGAAALAAFRPNARGRYLADLPLLARQQLADIGVTRIYGGTECTYGNPERYFSHRRDGQTGRQATLIWLDAPRRG
jgi:YfiH family protein